VSTRLQYVQAADGDDRGRRMLFLKTTPVVAAIFRCESAYPIKTNSVLEGLKRRADENPFYGAPAFSKENIVRGAGAG